MIKEAKETELKQSGQTRRQVSDGFFLLLKKLQDDAVHVEMNVVFSSFQTSKREKLFLENKKNKVNAVLR